MPSIEFKVSDSQKFDFLFNLLNPNFNETGGWIIDCVICEVYDEYAITKNYAEGIFERVYYKKDDQNDSLEIISKERCYIVDVNEAEKTALANIKGESTFEQVATAIADKDTTIGSLNEAVVTLNDTISTLTDTNKKLEEENLQYSTKVVDFENIVSTLTTEKDEITTNYENEQAKVAEIESKNSQLENALAVVTEERDNLAAYKKTVEDEAKKAVVDSYVEHLPEEVIENYMKNLDNYTIEELDKELTYEQKKANPNLFTKNPAPASNAMIPKDEGGNGINDILARYEKH